MSRYSKMSYRELLAEFPRTMPAYVAAEVLGMGHNSFLNAAKYGQLPFCIDASQDGGRANIKVLTRRLIAYLEAEDLKQPQEYSEAELLAQIFVSIRDILNDDREIRYRNALFDQKVRQARRPS